MYLYFRFYFMLTCLLRNLILLNVNLLLHNFYSICGAFLSFYVIVLTLLTFFLNVNFLTVWGERRGWMYIIKIIIPNHPLTLTFNL